MNWTFQSLGDGDFMYEVLLGISYFYNIGSDYTAMLFLASCFALLGGFYMTFFSGGKFFPVKDWAIGLIAFILLMGPATTQSVDIEEATTGAYIGRVDDVPLLLALGGTMFTNFAYSLTENLDVALSRPSGNSLASGARLSGTRSMAALRSFYNAEPEVSSLGNDPKAFNLRASLINYLVFCVDRDRSLSSPNQETSFSQIYSAQPKDLWGAMQVNYAAWETPVLLKNVTSATGSVTDNIEYKTCPDAYVELSKYIVNNDTTAGGKNLEGGLQTLLETKGGNVDSLDQLLQFQLNSLTVTGDAHELMKARFIHEALDSAQAQFPGGSAAELAVFQAQQQRRVQMASDSDLWLEMAPALITFIEGFVFFLGPVIGLILIMGGKGITAAITYFGILLWVNLWSVILVLVNLFTEMTLENRIGDISASGRAVFSYGGFDATMATTETYLAVSQTAATLAPVLALFVLYRGVHTLLQAESKMAPDTRVNTQYSAPDVTSPHTAGKGTFGANTAYTTPSGDMLYSYAGSSHHMLAGMSTNSTYGSGVTQHTQLAEQQMKAATGRQMAAINDSLTFGKTKQHQIETKDGEVAQRTSLEGVNSDFVTTYGQGMTKQEQESFNNVMRAMAAGKVEANFRLQTPQFRDSTGADGTIGVGKFVAGLGGGIEGQVNNSVDMTRLSQDMDVVNKHIQDTHRENKVDSAGYNRLKELATSDARIDRIAAEVDHETGRSYEQLYQEGKTTVEAVAADSTIQSQLGTEHRLDGGLQMKEWATAARHGMGVDNVFDTTIANMRDNAAQLMADNPIGSANYAEGQRLNAIADRLDTMLQNKVGTDGNGNLDWDGYLDTVRHKLGPAASAQGVNENGLVHATAFQSLLDELQSKHTAGTDDTITQNNLDLAGVGAVWSTVADINARGIHQDGQNIGMFNGFGRIANANAEVLTNVGRDHNQIIANANNPVDGVGATPARDINEQTVSRDATITQADNAGLPTRLADPQANIEQTHADNLASLDAARQQSAEAVGRFLGGDRVALDRQDVQGVDPALRRSLEALGEHDYLAQFVGSFSQLSPGELIKDLNSGSPSTSLARNADMISNLAALGDGPHGQNVLATAIDYGLAYPNSESGKLVTSLAMWKTDQGQETLQRLEEAKSTMPADEAARVDAFIDTVNAGVAAYDNAIQNMDDIYNAAGHEAKAHMAVNGYSAMAPEIASDFYGDKKSSGGQNSRVDKGFDMDSPRAVAFADQFVGTFAEKLENYGVDSSDLKMENLKHAPTSFDGVADFATYALERPGEMEAVALTGHTEFMIQSSNFTEGSNVDVTKLDTQSGWERNTSSRSRRTISADEDLTPQYLAAKVYTSGGDNSALMDTVMQRYESQLSRETNTDISDASGHNNHITESMEVLSNTVPVLREQGHTQQADQLQAFVDGFEQRRADYKP
ncbi:conjugal transfer protein TraG N-terminal domain-containing protein [Neiella sp. HB171785]|uniref:Conjugal transfer protein TraG N-terminal domain-containing protein n=1 Tax=Neiella litorisoli TaxID=2771431 RepID=A0A8J6QU70_9GAMM|nr:conjugal transfer protein TraG N-terminal domain-containing protein [Neiella litorisoli]MBD1389497.1 conjugal transfer protein TraG N-terminal domain-containing protein [Neiella litorisoli]